VKSPVETGGGHSAAVQLQLPATRCRCAKSSTQLGQNLVVPPNVKAGQGKTNGSTTTLLERKRFTGAVFRAVELKGRQISGWR
jgi:uncharacterized protein (DUF1800 family)